MHIKNLYQHQGILAFRRCYALEKVHGTSAHVQWSPHADGPPRLTFFAGGAKHEAFMRLFGDTPTLAERFGALGHPLVTVYGEAYGGSVQGMSRVYGKDLRFIVFDVKIGETWLAVPDAEQVATALGLEFVPYELISTDLFDIDAQRDASSVVAVRRGVIGPQRREGVVLRPPFEVRLNNGERLIAKHKGPEFSERATPPKVIDAATLAVLADAEKIAAEWVVEERLTHVIGHLTCDGVAPGIEATGRLIAAMQADVKREAEGELVWSKEVERAIGKRAAELFHARVKRLT